METQKGDSVENGRATGRNGGQRARMDGTYGRPGVSACVPDVARTMGSKTARPQEEPMLEGQRVHGGVGETRRPRVDKVGQGKRLPVEPLDVRCGGRKRPLGGAAVVARQRMRVGHADMCPSGR